MLLFHTQSHLKQGNLLTIGNHLKMTKKKDVTKEEHKFDNNANHLNNIKELRKETGVTEALGKNFEHPNLSTVEIGLNTEKNNRELKKLAVTRTSEKNSQLKLM